MELFDIPDAAINYEELVHAQSEDEFMSAAVDLSKELMRDLTLLLSSGEDENSWALSRNDAIIHGLMARMLRLFHSFMTLLCKKDDDGTQFLYRGVLESAVNAMFLIEKKDSQELFDDFVQYSLNAEKHALDVLNETVKARGYELDIEKRIKNSIDKAFNISGFSPEQIKSARKNSWAAISLEDKTKELGFEKMYTFGFRNAHHFAHGNWQSILRQHLRVVDDGKFELSLENKRPRPQMILGLQSIICTAAIKFIHYVFVDSAVISGFEDLFDKVMKERDKIDELYEQFLGG